MSEKIEVSGKQDIVDMWLIEAMIHDGDRKFMEVFFPNKGKGPCVAEVVMTINGVEVPFQKIARGFWDRANSHFDRHVLDKAKELVTEARLDKLMNALRDAEWQVESALDEALGRGKSVAAPSAPHQQSNGSS